MCITLGERSVTGGLKMPSEPQPRSGLNKIVNYYSDADA